MWLREWLQQYNINIGSRQLSLHAPPHFLFLNNFYLYWKIISYKTGILNFSSYLQDTIVLELYLTMIIL